MSTYHFKTNLKCDDCVAAIKPALDELMHNGDIEHWEVALQSPEKTLVVETLRLTPDKVKHLLREKGYEAQFTMAPGT
jgi:copper chaperone